MSDHRLVSTLTLWEPPPPSGDEKETEEDERFSQWNVNFLTRKPPLPQWRDHFLKRYSDAFELHARALVATLSTKLTIPRPHPTLWMQPRRIRATLSPTLRKHTGFADRSENVWKAVQKYFQPIQQAVARPAYLDFIAWPLYLMIVASRSGAGVTFNLDVPRQNFARLEARKVKGEAGARLALLESIFSAYTRVEEVPGLSIAPNRNLLIGERLAEILEDAYLLEASSKLKKFFSIQTNKAALKRDLRILTRQLEKRSWARNAVKGTTQLATLGSDMNAVGAALGEVLAGAGVRSYGAPPILDRRMLELEHSLPGGTVNTHYRLVTADTAPTGNSRLNASHGVWGTPNF